MNKPEFDVYIIYQDKPNPNTPYLRLPALPRKGEFIIIEGGNKYEVTAVIFDDRVSTRPADVSIEVKFHSIATFDS